MYLFKHTTLLLAFLVDVPNIARVSGMVATRFTICKLMYRDTARLQCREETPNVPGTIRIQLTLPVYQY